MGDTRDGWSKAEVIFGALGALGSIAIPIMLFVVGNRIAARQQARHASDYKKADAIRAELASRGVEIEDTPSGTRWKRRAP